MARALPNTNAVVWGTGDYDEYVLDVFQADLGSEVNSNMVKVDTAIGTINTNVSANAANITLLDGRVGALEQYNTTHGVATNSTLGLVKPDATTINVSAGGVISVDPDFELDSTKCIVDPIGLEYVTEDNVQEAIEQLDAAVETNATAISGKVDKSGGTMLGDLVAKTGTSGTCMRNVKFTTFTINAGVSATEPEGTIILAYPNKGLWLVQGGVYRDILPQIETHTHTATTVTLLQSDWVSEGNFYTVSAYVAWMTAALSPTVDVSIQGTTTLAVNAELDEWAKIIKVESLSSYVKFYAKECPSGDIVCKVKY